MSGERTFGLLSSRGSRESPPGKYENKETIKDNIDAFISASGHDENVENVD